LCVDRWVGGALGKMKRETNRILNQCWVLLKRMLLCTVEDHIHGSQIFKHKTDSIHLLSCMRTNYSVTLCKYSKPFRR
jgi:hypothetical protein